MQKNNFYKRGFGSMDRARVSEIAGRGGRAAHEKGTAHEWTSAEARIAGKKGGAAYRESLKKSRTAK